MCSTAAQVCLQPISIRQVSEDTRVISHIKQQWKATQKWDRWGVVMYSCLQGQAPWYLTDLCIPASDVSSRQHLWSATRCLLMDPWCRLSTLGPRAFSVAGPSLWNSLPDSLRDPDLGRDSFRRLKTHLFTLYWSIQHIRFFRTIQSTNWLTYLLTYSSRNCLRVSTLYHLAIPFYLSPHCVACGHIMWTSGQVDVALAEASTCQTTASLTASEMTTNSKRLPLTFGTANDVYSLISSCTPQPQVVSK